MAAELSVAPRPRTSNWDRVAAGAVILIGALGLILLGGCFLVGALVLVTNDFSHDARPPLSAEEGPLLIGLYVLTGLCLVGALVLVVLALPGLCKVLWDKRPTS
jgi:hypothetical protein